MSDNATLKKYLKYKAKYMQLKNEQYGGAKEKPCEGKYMHRIKVKKDKNGNFDYEKLDGPGMRPGVYLNEYMYKSIKAYKGKPFPIRFYSSSRESGGDNGLASDCYGTMSSCWISADTSVEININDFTLFQNLRATVHEKTQSTFLQDFRQTSIVFCRDKKK